MISALHAASKEDHWTRLVCDQEGLAGLYCVCTARVITQVPGAYVGNVWHGNLGHIGAMAGRSEPSR